MSKLHKALKHALKEIEIAAVNFAIQTRGYPHGETLAKSTLEPGLIAVENVVLAAIEELEERADSKGILIFRADEALHSIADQWRKVIRR